ESQTQRTERYPEYFAANDIIAGDFHFIRKFMPDHLPGKIIITNTVTTKDRALLQQAGVACLVTTTPNFDGRSFGTNVLEACLVALNGKQQALTAQDYERLLEEYNVQPGIDYLGTKELG
ncbi:MAG: quinate 5-dehydrogenase, partial [Acidaminococcaceae bacterium]